MNYQEAMGYIENIQTELASAYTLEEVTELCERMGRPDRHLHIIHIAGTNGKGSVGAYLSNALASNGYLVGRYVSPSLFDYRERIQIITGNQHDVKTEWISQMETAERITEISKTINQMCQEGYRHPTAFEIETVMAFCQMVKWKVDVAIIEVGLGGRLDATNLIEKPLVTVFTRISMDHMDILGKTLEEIAEQKFGIVKENVPVVSVRQESSIMKQLTQLCNGKELPLYIAEQGEILEQEYTLDYTSFWYREETFQLNQLGSYQPENVIIAWETLKVLQRTNDWKIDSREVKKALKETRWQGRFEVISRFPFLILDGAHNPSGAKVLRQSLENYFPGERFTYVFGVYRDKDYCGILNQTLSLAERIYTVKAAGTRGMEPEKLAEIIKTVKEGQQLPIESCSDVVTALEQIQEREEKEKIVVFGSLSFLQEIYRYFDTSI